MILHSKKSAVLLTLAAMLTMPTLAAADNWSFGAGGAAVSVWPGDFNGEKFIYVDNGYYGLDSDDQWFDMPYPSTNSTGFLLRAAYNRRFISGEVQYVQSSHAIQRSFIYDDPEGYMTFSFVDFNAKFNVPLMLMDIYFITGVHYAILSVDHGEWLSDTSNQSASYFGAGFNIGAGVSYYFTPFTSIYGEYIYRWSGYSIVSDVEIEESVYHGGIGTLLFGVSFHVPVVF